MKRVLVLLFLALGTATNAWAVDCTTPEVGATVVDLTTRGATGTVNGAIFEQIDPRSTGSGVIDPFVRINPGGSQNCEHGYNTDKRKLEFDENTSATFTHSLLLANVPVVTKGGIPYYQFMLDVNQNNSGATDHFLSLNKVEIYTSNAPDALGYPSMLGTIQWMLDGTGPAWIWLDYALNSGSGSGDMFMYVPTSAVSGTYVYLYSLFGENHHANDGYEEWSILRGATPSPSPSPSPKPSPSPTPKPSPSPTPKPSPSPTPKPSPGPGQ